MVLIEEKRGRKPSDRRSTASTSKGVARPYLGLFAPLFGSRPVPASPPPRKHRSRDRDRDKDRERDRDKERDRERDRDPHRRKDKDRDRDNDRGKPSSHHHHPRSLQRRHHDHSHQKLRHHRRPKSPQEPRPIVVEVLPIDPRHRDFKLRVRTGTPITKLEAVVLRRYEECDGEPLPESTFFRFYAKGKELEKQDEVNSNLSTIWYQMSRVPGELDHWKFTHWQDETHGRLESSITDELVRAIEGGATVGQLRRKIADYMEIEDENRVVLIARGGIRLGPDLLQGDCWELRQVKDKWLCRWLSIDIVSEGCYLRLKGLGRQYIYHPKLEYIERGMEVRTIKKYLDTRLFPAVNQQGEETGLKIGWKNIGLNLDGNCLSSFSSIEWGKAYDFELPPDAAETFSDEETWLLAATETCSACIEDKKLSELPIKITAACSHKATICKDCLKQWLESGLQSGTWDRLKCPDCSEVLRFEDVKRYASSEIFARYDTLVTRAALKDIPNFRFCLSTKCESGQIVDDKCPKYKCKACGEAQCVKHDVLWHAGETCDEYDERNRKRKKDEKASENMIKKTSKKCPECKKDIHKYTGCNHITCVCRHEWCYLCFAAYQRNQHGFLFCRHLPTCTERDPFIDLVDLPNGGEPRPNNFWPPAGFRPGPGQRPHPFLPPGFVPPHLRRANNNNNNNPAGGGPGGNGGPARRGPPPPPDDFFRNWGMPRPNNDNNNNNNNNNNNRAPNVPPVRPGVLAAGIAATVAANAARRAGNEELGHQIDNLIERLAL
ncbi:hypothetical protein B0H63DRAFT_53930 [Podospora didyma]|uniref:RBR-type E3 ubiquitin transferase n=1 Tax=Podospora didyma TaxID=330526 RepID=A0AAE0P7C9_9PEZI|nr:hypothetical protein B0H63DRAFT_53930 [Podospora didyma]